MRPPPWNKGLSGYQKKGGARLIPKVKKERKRTPWWLKGPRQRRWGNAWTWDEKGRTALLPKFVFLEHANQVCDLIGLLETGEIVLIELKKSRNDLLRPIQKASKSAFGSRFWVVDYEGNQISDSQR